MDIHPEMEELRDALGRLGVECITHDEEYGINIEGDPVPVEEANRFELDGFTHIEETTFASSDGRVFCVSYIWTIDDDGGKVFLSKHGDMGYLEARVGMDSPYSAYAEEIVEAAFGRCL